MMELDEAIKHAEEVADRNEKKASWFWGKEGNPNYENCVECAKEHRQLADWLKELKRLREQTRWISCSERLPEVGGRYIVTEKRFSVDDRKHNGRYQTVVEEVNFSNNIWNRANFIEVVAWMPIPKPYREEDQYEDGN